MALTDITLSGIVNQLQLFANLDKSSCYLSLLMQLLVTDLFSMYPPLMVCTIVAIDMSQTWYEVGEGLVQLSSSQEVLLLHKGQLII